MIRADAAVRAHHGGVAQFIQSRRHPDQQVVTKADTVLTGTAHQRVIAGTALHRVMTCATGEAVIAGAEIVSTADIRGDHRIGAAAGERSAFYPDQRIRPDTITRDGRAPYGPQVEIQVAAWGK